MNIFKTLWNLIFRKSNLEPLHDIIEAESRIMLWESVFRGEPSWLDVSHINLYGRKQARKRKTMKPAKLITHELSSLIWSEEPELEIDDSIKAILEESDFFVNMPKKSERLMALGGMALKLFVKDGVIYIDYIPAQRFIPVSWDNKRIYEADFIDKFTKDKKEYIRVESHRKTETGYNVSNSVYEKVSEANMMKADLASVAPQYQESVDLPVSEPLFSYIANPEENNFSSDSPLGISMYANAIDTLESLDIAFDALQSEILLGRKRIIVPSSAVRKTFSQDGDTVKMVRYFDPSDEVYQAFDFDEAKGLQIQDNSVELRINEIRLAVQTLLDILSVQVGFSAGYLSFDASGVKTATEVISDNSKTFKTKKFWENAIGAGVLQICESIRAIAPLYGVPVSSGEYSIIWNDSIIEDSNAKLDRLIKEKDAGLIPAWKALAEYKGISEEEAKKLVEDAKNESANIDIGSMFGGAE